MVTLGLRAWSQADLARLVGAGAAGIRLDALGRAARAPTTDPREIDLVLWTKLGRSVAEACDLLNGRAAAQRSR